VSESDPPPDGTRDVLTELDRLLNESQRLREQERHRRERRSFFPDRRRQDIGHMPDRRRSPAGQ
jgi:hypothetical protein